jgi:hypothetical protein
MGDRPEGSTCEVSRVSPITVKEDAMKKFLFTLLVVVIGLAPALAVAQGTGGGATGAPGSSDKSSDKSSPSGGSSGSGTSGSGSPSGSSPTSPSASPSMGKGGSSDLAQYKTKADCEKNGGQWQAATSTCGKSSK